jgi:glyoxylase-like metal-dependent hydrolase (beta-lactamase superfamily II)
MPAVHSIPLGGVHCYLVEHAGAFVLVDTGYAARRRALVRALEKAGCTRATLRLVVLTHGDTDHTGNCAFLQEAYRVPVAMHEADAGMAESGDMRLGRKPKMDRLSLPFRVVTKIAPARRFPSFTPDLLLADGQRLDEWGVPATVYHTPGHSAGSLSVVTDDGNLICGDLLKGFGRPGLHFLISDLPQSRESVRRLMKMDIRMVYPGHGKSFAAETLGELRYLEMP